MKKITIYRIILIILIIVAVILGTLVLRKRLKSNQVESLAKEVLSQIKSGESIQTDTIDVIKEIDAEIEGYKVIGIINIPKIDIEYPILEKTETKSLNLSITKFWGQKINQKGNVVLAGHNNINNRFFAKINRLEIGDIIELTDNQMVTIQYKVFTKYKVDPNDISIINADDENTREVTLVTCTNGAKERLIVKAREVNI